MSNDTLYGQGLKEDDSARCRGSWPRPGNKYQMYEIPFRKMIQPRVGATWAYNGRDTIYASYARYSPGRQFAAARGLVGAQPRGASRRVTSTRTASLFGSRSIGSLVGQAVRGGHDAPHHRRVPGRHGKQINPNWSAALYGRYREANHFWEDTNNDARVAFNPPAGIPRELYIPDLAAQPRRSAAARATSSPNSTARTRSTTR